MGVRENAPLVAVLIVTRNADLRKTLEALKDVANEQPQDPEPPAAPALRIVRFDRSPAA